MGQYYRTVNVTKNEYVEKIDKTDWGKLTETAFIKNNSMGGMLPALLLDSASVMALPDKFKAYADSSFPWGAWCGDIVVRAGDYDNDTSLITEQQIIQFNIEKEEGCTVNLYSLCSYDIYNHLTYAFKNSITDENLYLINHTKKQYISIANYIKQKNISNDGWIYHPLPLLIAKTIEVAGGDYYHNAPNAHLIGYWAGDSISTSFIQPNLTEFMQILPFFKD